MSSTSSFGPAGEPEYLAHGGSSGPSRRRSRLGILTGVGVLATGAVAAGAWGVAQLMGGGPGAAQVLPDTTLAYLAIDLDPSAGQKIEAIRTLNKFPAIAEELGIDAQDDVRRWLVDKLRDEDCPELDYDRDVEPWIGDKAAVAVLPHEEHGAEVVLALQVTDQGDAERGMDEILSMCGSGEQAGTAFRDGYLLVAESDEAARGVAEATDQGSLADAPAYQEAVESLGEVGVVISYVAPGAPKELWDATFGSWSSTGPAPSATPPGAGDFRGLAATVRFEGGGLELAVAGRGVGGLGTGALTATQLGDLPASTVAALGLALPSGWAEDAAARLRESLGEELYEEGLRTLEGQTGLELPDDLAAALGDGLVAALDGSTDFDALAAGRDPRLIRAGVRLQAEEAAVRRVVDALTRAAGGAIGQPGDLVKVRSADGRAAVGFDDAYLDSLLAGGDLADSETFRKAVPEPDRASLAIFVDFDAADHWLDRLMEDLSSDPATVANAEPLRALGVGAWAEGDTGHLVLRLATD